MKICQAREVFLQSKHDFFEIKAFSFFLVVIQSRENGEPNDFEIDTNEIDPLQVQSFQSTPRYGRELSFITDCCHRSLHKLTIRNGPMHRMGHTGVPGGTKRLHCIALIKTMHRCEN